jgi:NitT/TauT family transport system permease protein
MTKSGTGSTIEAMIDATVKRLSHAGPTIVGATTFVLAGVIAEALLRLDILNRYIIPLPTQVLASFGRLFAEEDIAARFILTFGEAAAAGFLVAVIGMSTGVLLYKVSTLRRATETWVAAAAAAPVILAYPLFLVIFGRSAMTIIMIGAVSGLPPMILKTLEGLAATRPALINVGRSFNLTPGEQFWKILFPAAMPTIFVGLRLALIFCLINIVGVEFLINFGGLGQLVNHLAERYDMPGTYAAIAFVIMVSVLFFLALERVERWLRPMR